MYSCHICQDEGCPACRWGWGPTLAVEVTLIERVRRLRWLPKGQPSSTVKRTGWPAGATQGQLQNVQKN